MWPFDRAKKKREFIQGLGKSFPKTPDIIEVQAQPWKLMFLCDDTMKAHKNHSLTGIDSRKVGRGFTQQTFDYRIGRHTGRGLPFVDKNGLKIKGELHAVKSEIIPRLDNHYDNGVQFARVRVNVIVTDRDHRLMEIGSEEFLKDFPPGMIRTVPELNLRHYISHPKVCIIRASMYVALKAFWYRDADATYPQLTPQFPKDPLVWLPRYYKYPIERNNPKRCPK